MMNKNCRCLIFSVLGLFGNVVAKQKNISFLSHQSAGAGAGERSIFLEKENGDNFHGISLNKFGDEETSNPKPSFTWIEPSQWTTSFSPMGDSDCKCLPWDEIRQKLPLTKGKDGTEYVKWTPQPESVDFEPKDVVHKVSPNFGAFCNAWDAPQANFGESIWTHSKYGCPKKDDDGESTHEYEKECFATFCYVDPCKCNKFDIAVSGMFAAQYDTAKLLAVSYNTCAQCSKRGVSECEDHPHCKVNEADGKKFCGYPGAGGDKDKFSGGDYWDIQCKKLSSEEGCNKSPTCKWSDDSCGRRPKAEMDEKWGCKK